MIRADYDDVNGVIVGGDSIGWCVAYDGRTQSQKQYADTSEAAESAGRALIATLKAECCGHPLYLYPDAPKWEVRIYE